MLVPCGMEKSTKPPKCRQKCKNPPDCHHESRQPHSCHFGPCPPCKQICQEKMACGHICPKPCHDQVVVKVQDKKAKTPWENKGIHSCGISWQLINLILMKGNFSKYKFFFVQYFIVTMVS